MEKLKEALYAAQDASDAEHEDHSKEAHAAAEAAWQAYFALCAEINQCYTPHCTAEATVDLGFQGRRCEEHSKIDHSRFEALRDMMLAVLLTRMADDEDVLQNVVDELLEVLDDGKYLDSRDGKMRPFWTANWEPGPNKPDLDEARAAHAEAQAQVSEMIAAITGQEEPADG